MGAVAQLKARQLHMEVQQEQAMEEMVSPLQEAAHSAMEEQPIRMVGQGQEKAVMPVVMAALQEMVLEEPVFQ